MAMEFLGCGNLGWVVRIEWAGDEGRGEVVGVRVRICWVGRGGGEKG